MADLRHFAKLDLGYFENPKVADLLESSPYTLIVHLRAVLYCRQHLTDGKFPTALVARLACGSYCGSQCDGQCDVCKARNANLIHRVSDRHDEVHDYLEHQDSAEQAARRKTAGQKAAEARWGKTDPANGNANGNADRIADGNAEKRREEKSSSRRTPQKPLPDDWQPNDKHQRYATERGVDLAGEAFRFRNHALSHDRRAANWNAAFTNWLSRAVPSAATPSKPKDAWW